MTKTQRLSLPLIAPEQAQKHVTHNEAILMMDALVHLSVDAFEASMPPADPAPGMVVAMGAEPEGDWTGQGGKLAAWTEGGWRFATPREGWMGWNAQDGQPCVYRDGTWTPMLSNTVGMGIGTDYDDTNRLSVRSEAALFTAISETDGGNGNLRLTLNKQSAMHSASVMFQSGFSGRAEIGLAGNDDFAFKVSVDGIAWKTALTLDAEAGFVRFEQMAGAVVSHAQIEGGVLAVSTSHVVPAPESGSSDQIESIDGGFDGALLILTGTDGVSISFIDGAGNLRLGADRTLASAADSLMLVRRGDYWLELSYAANT